MKKQVIATFLALMLTVPLMSGCGKQSEQPNSAIESTAAETSAAADTTDSAQEDATFTYDGTFNEEVFQHITKNIELFGHKVSMPCTLADLGEEFSTGEDNPYVDTEYSFVIYSLYFNEQQIGQITYNCDHELSETELKTLPFCNLSVSQYTADQNDSSISGFTLQDTFQQVQDALGTPTDASGYNDNGKGYVRYALTESQNISFFINQDQSIREIAVQVASE